MTSIKLKLMALSVLVLSFSAPSQANAQDCLCGDMNGDFIVDILDLQPLIDHLIGIPLSIDTFCASVDGGRDITLNDFMRMWDHLFISFSPLGCDTTRILNYPTSPIDTIFIPGPTVIPAEQSRVDLPLFASYGQMPHFRGAYIPVRALGTGSDDLFSLTNIRGEFVFATDFMQGSRIDLAGDTSALIYFKDSLPEPVEQIASLEYTRVQTGQGNIIPQIVGSVLGRRMVISDWTTIPGILDPQVPQIKTYTPSPCCSAGAGNVDCDPNDVVDIADLTMLIDHLFINFFPLCCNSEANIDLDTDVTVDISDLTVLIDHLFISFPPLASCQRPFLDD